MNKQNRERIMKKYISLIYFQNLMKKFPLATVQVPVRKLSCPSNQQLPIIFCCWVDIPLSLVRSREISGVKMIVYPALPIIFGVNISAAGLINTITKCRMFFIYLYSRSVDSFAPSVLFCFTTFVYEFTFTCCCFHMYIRQRNVVIKVLVVVDNKEWENRAILSCHNS